MTPNRDKDRIGYRGGRVGWGVQGFFAKLLAFAATILLAVGAIAISLAMFAVFMAGILVVGAYLWWKTRDLRKQMRAMNPNGRVIEGEIIEGEIIQDERPRNADRR